MVLITSDFISILFGCQIANNTYVGLKGIHFKIWNFFTLVQNASQLQLQLEAKSEINEEMLFEIKNALYVTKIENIFQKYHLNELPQLFNVIREQMSLVGSRLLLAGDEERFTPENHFRYEVLPEEITGFWRVSDHSDIESKNLFNLDFKYIENQS